MSAAHTPEPWIWHGENKEWNHEGHILAHLAPSRQVGEYAGLPNSGDFILILSRDARSRLTKANARLIAAAPGLLAACTYMVAQINAGSNIKPGHASYDAAVAAIAATKGASR